MTTHFNEVQLNMEGVDARYELRVVRRCKCERYVAAPKMVFSNQDDCQIESALVQCVSRIQEVSIGPL